jgi:hypothetical protein
MYLNKNQICGITLKTEKITEAGSSKPKYLLKDQCP